MKILISIVYLVGIITLVQGQLQQLIDQMREADVDKAKPGDIVLNWGSSVKENNNNQSK